MMRRTPVRVGIILVLLGFTLCATACSAGGGGDFAPSSQATPAAANTGGNPSAAKEMRKIIRDAKLTLSVKSVKIAFHEIRKAVPEWGGYLADSQLNGAAADRQEATLQIRVPSETLDRTLAQLAEMGDVVTQSETGQDVSEEYSDQESQLRNLQVAEKRLLHLLEQTGSVKDLLEVETQVTETRGKIEAIQGRLNALDNRVSYATIDIRLVENRPLATTRFWALGETVSDAQSMSLHILRALVTATIYLAFLLPFGLPLWLLQRWVARRPKPARQVRVQTPPVPGEEPPVGPL